MDSYNTDIAMNDYCSRKILDDLNKNPTEFNIDFEDVDNLIISCAILFNNSISFSNDFLNLMIKIDAMYTYDHIPESPEFDLGAVYGMLRLKDAIKEYSE